MVIVFCDNRVLLEMIKQIEALYDDIYNKCIELYFAQNCDDQAFIYKDIISKCDWLKYSVKNSSDLKKGDDFDVLNRVIKKAYFTLEDKKFDRVYIDKWNPDKNPYDELQFFLKLNECSTCFEPAVVLDIFKIILNLLNQSINIEVLCLKVNSVFFRYGFRFKG